jgi:hypothetical protein
LNVYYKNARIKQYHKENRALRTETTINNTYDFGVGKRLHNLAKLRAIGFAANQRRIEVERLSHDCILSEDTLQAINRPVTAGRQRASSLRFADPGVQALLQALILFRPARLSGRRSAPASCGLVRPRSGSDHPGRSNLTTAPASPPPYRPHAQRLSILHHRSRLACALFLTRTDSRLMRAGLTAALPALRATATPLKRDFDALTAKIDAMIAQGQLITQNLTHLRQASFVKHG